MQDAIDLKPQVREVVKHLSLEGQAAALKLMLTPGSEAGLNYIREVGRTFGEVDDLEWVRKHVVYAAWQLLMVVCDRLKNSPQTSPLVPSQEGEEEKNFFGDRNYG